MSVLADAPETSEAAGSGRLSRAMDTLSRVSLPHMLALALVLRLAVMPFATPVHPDEVFQYLEPAHRLVFGRGVVTWEWRYFIRGWLVPWLVSGPMALGAWLAPGTALYLVLPNVAMAFASLTTVVFAWRLGERLSLRHAQVAGFVAATWCEFIYFGPHVMSETLATALILPAALVLTDRPRWTARRLATAAALLAMAGSIRFQYLPAIATLALACCALRLRESWWPLLLGGLMGLLPSVAADLAMGEAPFAWLFINLHFNIGENYAVASGASGPLGFVDLALRHLTVWVVPLALLGWMGAKRFPAVAWMTAVNFVVHSALGHKEYRYILLSVFVLVVLAAIGTVDWAERLSKNEFRPPGAG